MPRSTIAIEGSNLRPQFLDGLAPLQRKTILGAATKRRFCANSVATNEGHPADHLFLLTKGLARCFIITEEGRKLLFQWLGPGDLFGSRALLSIRCAYLFSTETVTDTSVFVWDRPTIRELIGRYPRLLENGLLTASDYVAWHLSVSDRSGLPYCSTAGCSSTRYSCPYDWERCSGRYRAAYHQRGVGERGECHALYRKPPY